MIDRMMKLAVTVAILAAAALAPARAQTSVTAGSSWVNELGSVLTINSVAANGLMTGTYTTNVGCSAGTPQPMTGWYYGGNAGGAITFSVYWNGCNSVTSWSGQYNINNGNFQALWHLTLAAAPAWNGIYAGTDSFTPQGSMKAKK
jgi:hypothetical protein